MHNTHEKYCTINKSIQQETGVSQDVFELGHLDR